MEFSLPAKLLILLIAGSALGQQTSVRAPNSSTDSVSWGSPVKGLRLGVAFGSDPSTPTLRVLLQNVGSDFGLLRADVAVSLYGAPRPRGPRRPLDVFWVEGLWRASNRALGDSSSTSNCGAHFPLVN